MTADRLLARRCRDLLARLAAACGCPPRACEVLVALCALPLPHGGASVSELAEATSLTLPTASRAVGALEGRGLVRTVVDPRDHRRLAVAVTQRGQAVVATVCGMPARAGTGGEGMCSPASSGALAASADVPGDLRDAWELRRFGVSVEEASLLAALAQGPADVTELARACELPRSTAGFTLGALDRAGKVVRLCDPDARRSVFCLPASSPAGAAHSCPGVDPASVATPLLCPDAPTSQLNSGRFGVSEQALL